MELEATFKRAIHVWWAFMWRSIIASIVGSILGGILGGILGFIMGSIGFSPGAISFISFILGLAIGLAISVVPVKFILDKDYGEFNLILLSKSEGMHNLEVTWSRTVNVWWAYVWRNFLLLIGWGVVVFIISRLTGSMLRSIGATDATIIFFGIVLLIVVLISGLILSVIPVKWILGKDFGEFKLALLSNTSESM